MQSRLDMHAQRDAPLRMMAPGALILLPSQFERHHAVHTAPLLCHQNQCADKHLRSPAAGATSSLLSCLPNRACKVNSLLRIFAISLNKQRSFLAASIASSVRHQRGNDLHSPGGVHAFLRVQHFGCRMLFIKFVNRAVQAVRRSRHVDGSRQEIADIPRFAAPPGDAHRARGSLIFAPLQHAECDASANPS